MKKRLWIYVLIVAVLAAGWYGWTEYHRKPDDLRDILAREKVDVKSLAMAFRSDEVTATKRYLGKVVEVDGRITEVNLAQLPWHIIIGNESEPSNVGISLSANYQDTARLKVGELVTVRGECTGFLMDVELNNAVIIK